MTWIHHGCTCVSHPEHPSLLPPRTISLGHLSAPAPSTLYHASNLDWQSFSHMIIYMFQCHSPKPSPTESERLFYTSVSLLLSHMQGYCYLLSKFHIYALVYCIGDYSFIMFSNFINVLVPDKIFFLIMLNNILLYVYISFSLFTNLLMGI